MSSRTGWRGNKGETFWQFSEQGWFTDKLCGKFCLNWILYYFMTMINSIYQRWSQSNIIYWLSCHGAQEILFEAQGNGRLAPSRGRQPKVKLAGIRLDTTLSICARFEKIFAMCLLNHWVSVRQWAGSGSQSGYWSADDRSAGRQLITSCQRLLFRTDIWHLVVTDWHSAVWDCHTYVWIGHISVWDCNSSVLDCHSSVWDCHCSVWDCYCSFWDC